MAAKADLVKLVIPCDAKYLQVARLTVAAVAARTELTVDDIEDVKVAVSEACTNVIDHAYADEATGEAPSAIELIFQARGDELQIDVTDEGVGFDPRRVQSPEADLRDREGGLGLYLMEGLMDRVEIQSAPGSGTRVTMVKRASR